MMQEDKEGERRIKIKEDINQGYKVKIQEIVSLCINLQLVSDTSPKDFPNEETSLVSILLIAVDPIAK
jgi:hypothetical protein